MAAASISAEDKTRDRRSARRCPRRTRFPGETPGKLDIVERCCYGHEPRCARANYVVPATATSEAVVRAIVVGEGTVAASAGRTLLEASISAHSTEPANLCIE